MTTDSGRQAGAHQGGEITNEMVEEMLFEIRTWDHGRGFSSEELANRLLLALSHGRQSRLTSGDRIEMS